MSPRDILDWSEGRRLYHQVGLYLLSVLLPMLSSEHRVIGLATKYEW